MEFIINKTRFEILDYFRSGKENSKGKDFLNARAIDFGEIVIKENEVGILRKPRFTSPFRPLGKIVISISEISDSKTRLIGKVFPYNGKGLILIVFLIIFLLIFTIGSLFVSQDSNIILMISIAWIMVAIGITFEYYNTRSGLVKYLNEIIETLKNEK